MNELIEKLNGFLEAAAGVVQEYGPEVADAALLVIRLNAIMLIVFSIAFLWGAFMFFKWARLNVTALADCNNDQEIAHIFAAIGKAVIGFILGLTGLTTIVKPYLWIAAFDPMLGLVYKAAQSVGLL